LCLGGARIGTGVGGEQRPAALELGRQKIEVAPAAKS